ncbi:MAG: hypothetical protein ACLQGP_28500 [Isosphaeraceae bacterium]
MTTNFGRPGHGPPSYDSTRSADHGRGPAATPGQAPNSRRNE